MGRDVRKPEFCMCENKVAFVFATQIVQSLYFFKNHDFKPLAIFSNYAAPSVSDLVRNPEDRFSDIVTHMMYLPMLNRVL